eukprot:4347462-Prymnesium_polylepis.1
MPHNPPQEEKLRRRPSCALEQPLWSTRRTTRDGGRGRHDYRKTVLGCPGVGSSVCAERYRVLILLLDGVGELVQAKAVNVGGTADACVNFMSTREHSPACADCYVETTPTRELAGPRGHVHGCAFSPRAESSAAVQSLI